MSKRFGRYIVADEVTDELGRGGFGRVYRAFDPNVKRYVAVKVLSSASDPDVILRFQDESKTAGQLEHENIVKIYDFDLQDGVPYLVMELLDGETLETIIKTQFLAGRPIQLLEKVEIMFQVAKGLQYAHAENVIHRDIKPGNIMVMPKGTVKLMDFGIARVVDKDGTRRTRQGDLAGTILYMAPEQFGGQDADRRTDIFAYAEVYYELLTGEHPFYGKDFASVMYRVTADEPRSIRERVPECPEALESLIHRLLVKDREMRPDRLDEVTLETRPVLQDLRRERAAVLAAEIESMVTAGDLEGAQTAIRQVLQWDPQNRVANRWRGELQQERARKARQMRVEGMVREGREQAGTGRFKEALQAFESALKLDPSNPEIRQEIDQVQKTIENTRMAGQLVTEARVEMARGNLEAALEKATRAAEVDAGNREAPGLADRLREQIRSRQEAAVLARAEGLCHAGDYDAALAVLSEAETAGQSSPKIAACRVRVAGERAEAEKRRRQARFAAGLAGAKEALDGQRLQEACDRAEALCAEFPEEPAAAELLSEVREHVAAQRRREAINQTTQAARNLIKEKRLEDARQMLYDGLRAYPRDTGISRLVEIVETLVSAQERGRKIGQSVRQAHSLAESGQVDEALEVINSAISEFGEDHTLAECKRNYERASGQRRYALGLQARLEQGRRLLAEGNPAGAISLLEDAMQQYPGEQELGALLATARGALAVLREQEFVKQQRAKVAVLETGGQYGAALALLEAALARYPANAEFLDTAGQLRRKLQEQELKRVLAAHIQRIDQAVQSGNWDLAARSCEAAQADFPSERALAGYAVRIADTRRERAIQQLQASVQGSFARQDLAAAEGQLIAARAGLSQSPAWQRLWQELERHRVYAGDLKRAAEARAAGMYDTAEELLRPWLPEAPDVRAEKLLESVTHERREAAERARRAAEIRAVIDGRREAEALILLGDYQGGIRALDELAARYPGHPEIQQDRETAARELERRGREAEEQARRLQDEAAVARGRSEAEALVGKGDYQGAIVLLDRLEGQYPDRAEIQQDREAAREAAIAKGRSKAEALVGHGDYQSAIVLLDRLADQYPGRAEIQRDREAAQAGEVQRREAEQNAAVATGRAEAQALVGKGDYQGAIVLLDRLADQYPGRAEIQQDREAARAGEVQRREAEQNAAIAKGRSEAVALVGKGDYQGAIVLLDQLAEQYPGRAEIQRDSEAARAGEVQRREAELNAAIAKGRSEAEALVRKGDYQDAIVLLDRLARQYPGRAEIQRDCEAAREAIIANGRGDAEVLVKQGDYQGAIGLLDRLVDQYPGRAEIQRDREAAREAAIAKQRGDAEVLARQGDYQGAIAILDQLATQYPGRPEVQREREAAAAELERRRRAEEEEARRQQEEVALAIERQNAARLLQNGDYAGAAAVLQELVRAYPDRPEIRQDLAAAVKEGIDRVRAEAARLVEKGDPAGALAILDGLAKEYPGRAEIEQDHEAAALSKTRREAAALAEKGDYKTAISRLRPLAVKHPDHAGIREDLKSAEFGIGRQEASGLVARGAYEDAIRLLDRLAQTYGSHPETKQNRQAAVAGVERLRVEAAIAKARRDAAALSQKGDYEGAIRVLDEVAGQHSGHDGIESDRKAARRDLERQIEEAAVAKGRDEAAALMRAGKYPEAIAQLEELARQYPGHGEIRRDVEATQRVVERQRHEAALTQACADAAALIQNGDWQGASTMLDEAARKFPGRPGETLSRRLEQLRREAIEEAQRQRVRAAIERARQEIEEFVRKSQFQEAIGVLDRLVAQYPVAAKIQADRDAVAAAWEQHRRETEERAKRALAVFAARRREAGEAAAPVPPREDAEQRAKAALAVLSARKDSRREEPQPVEAAQNLKARLQDQWHAIQRALRRPPR